MRGVLYNVQWYKYLFISFSISFWFISLASTLGVRGTGEQASPWCLCWTPLNLREAPLWLLTKQYYSCQLPPPWDLSSSCLLVLWKKVAKQILNSQFHFPDISCEHLGTTAALLAICTVVGGVVGLNCFVRVTLPPLLFLWRCLWVEILILTWKVPPSLLFYSLNFYQLKIAPC